MKGIISASGRSTRLYPMTLMISKQLLPIYDKPLIYYPLPVLLLTGIREILLTSTPEGTHNYRRLLGDSTRIGVSIEYKVQEQPRGLAEAFILGEEFIAEDQVCLILGDNTFHGQDFTAMLKRAQTGLSGATIFGYPIKNPTNFSVVAFDTNFNMQSIEEKPKKPKSHLVVPGLHFYNNSMVEITESIAPPVRDELEITAVNDVYSRRDELQVVLLGHGIAWLDTGTSEGILQATEYVEAVQTRQGLYISCIEEIAWRHGFITTEQLRRLGEASCMADYGQCLLSLKD